jgi:AraC-like DNA-binding protein
MMYPAMNDHMNLAIKDRRLAKPGSENATLRDYDSVRRAIGFISENWRNQPTIEAMADAASVTPDELHHLFRRWAGLTPKDFMQALTLDHAKGLLRNSASVLDAALDSGLSGPGRLHDLFVAGRMEERRRRHDAKIWISPLAVRDRNRDCQRPRPGWSRVCRSRRRTTGAGRHAAALAARDLCRGHRRHR